MSTATQNLVSDIHFLVSNVPQSSSEKTISIVVLKSDLKAKKAYPRFYAYREGMIYDPENKFKPMNRTGGQKLQDGHVSLFYGLVNEAKKAYDKAVKELNETAPTATTDTSFLENVIKEQQKELDKMKELLNKPAVPAVPAEKSSAEIELELLKKQFEALKQQLEPKQPVRHEKFNVIKKWLELGRSVYIWGPAGTGKSHMMEQIAVELYGTSEKFFLSNAITDKFSLTGYEDAGGTFRPTPFYKAFTQGGLFFIDELDSSVPEALTVLNTALAQGHFDFPSVGLVKAHPDFRCVSAGNTVGRGADTEYTGRYAIDQSSLNRFEFIYVTYSPAIEEELVQGDTELLEFIRDIRQTAVETEISLLVTYRQITGMKAMGELQPLEDTIDQTIIKGLPSDDLRLLIKNMNVSASNKYLKALKKLA